MTQKKMEALEMLDADIYVIQECTKANFDEVIAKKYDFKSWYGDSQEYSDLGIAVFSNTCKIEFTSEFYRQFRYVVPYKVTKDETFFTLFAVWTKKDGYEKILYDAVKEYIPLLKSNAVVIGDYNVGACKGKPERYNELVKAMGAVGLSNCAKEGAAHEPTSLWHKDPYQNDYCFASENIAAKSFEVIKDERFTSLSDHCPIIVDFDF
jgi:exonuclease III